MNVEDAAPTPIPGVSVQGRVHGGVFPIEGATIRLMVTQSNGYGGKALNPLTTTSDQNGNFNFPNTGWSCASGQFAYITVTSGYTVNLGTTTNNNKVIQVGAIGPCSDLATSSQIANVNVFVSELSTVAAAYALGNFITVDNTNAASGQQIVNISAPAKNNGSSATCAGTGSAMSCTAAGLAHAFANAYALVDSVRYDGSFPSGQTRQYNPTQVYFSAVPQQLINTIGNVLQSCVDSIGGSACSTLFGYTTTPSSASDINCTGGTAPGNTLQAALNMAKYPVCQITNRFGLQPVHEFFTPDLATAPTSFTVSIFYGVGYGGNQTPYPIDVALDAADNAYVLYGGNSGGTSNYGAIYAISPSGSLLFSPTGNGSIAYPTQIATDTAGHVYVTNNDPNTQANGAIFMASTSKGVLSQVALQHNASGVAIDQLNNVWSSVANTTDYSVNEYTAASMTSSTGTAIAAFYSGVGANPVTGLAIDGNQNVWGASGGITSSTGNTPSIALVLPNNSAGKYTTNSSGVSTPATPSYGMAGAAGYTQNLKTTGGFGLTIDSTGKAYFPLAGQLDSATYSSSGGFIVNPGGSATTSGSNAPQRSAMDGAGSIFWADLEQNGQMFAYTPGTGALISFLPCYPYPMGSGYQCITTANQSAGNSIYTPSNLRSMAVDSAGDLWYVADAGYGAIIETLGLAAPAWPQLSYGHPGTEPQ